MARDQSGQATFNKILNRLLDDRIHELAAQWNGGTDLVAHVIDRGDRPLPEAFWMVRTEAAGPLLHMADDFRFLNPNAKSMLHRMAADLLKPFSGKKLQCVVVTSAGAGLADIAPGELDALNRKGASPNATNARKQFLNSQRNLVQSCIEQSGEDLEDTVVYVIDPKDPRAAQTAYLLKTAAEKMASRTDLFEEGAPIVLASGVAKAKALYRSTRKSIFEWLDTQPALGSFRVVCMAHGGETCTHAKVALTQRAPLA